MEMSEMRAGGSVEHLTVGVLKYMGGGNEVGSYLTAGELKENRFYLAWRSGVTDRELKDLAYELLPWGVKFRTWIEVQLVKLRRRRA